MNYKVFLALSAAAMASSCSLSSKVDVTSCPSTVTISSSMSRDHQYTYFKVINRSASAVVVQVERSLIYEGRRVPDAKPVNIRIRAQSQENVPGSFPTRQQPRVKLLGCR